jgi:hypothetical protein
VPKRLDVTLRSATGVIKERSIFIVMRRNIKNTSFSAAQALIKNLIDDEG